MMRTSATLWALAFFVVVSGWVATAPPIWADSDTDAQKKEHWAWKPIIPPVMPSLTGVDQPAAPIDALVRARLRDADLAQAAPAEKRVLLRRATFDLIGLPPTPEEVAAFLDDSAPDAFAKVVDRLLASPHFGERWARHWLDVVRYAETLGHESDFPINNAWRYRDYVIRAFNADVPYNQFVREHIAGDLIDPPRLHPTDGYDESVIATAAWYLGEAVHAPVDSRADQMTRLDNQVDVLSKAFLGLTVACARCHDHKFDAISSKDYYALAGYAASSHQHVALLDPGGRIEAGAKQLANLHDAGRDALYALASNRSGDESPYLTRLLLAARAASSSRDSSKSDRIAEYFEDNPKGLKRLLAEIELASGASDHPLHAWSRLAPAGAPDDEFESRRVLLMGEIANRAQQAAARQPQQATFEDFSSGYGRWFRSGWAFGDRPSEYGDCVATATDAQPIAAGLAHSGRLGNHLRGDIRSATFTIEKPYIHYRLAGRHGRVHVVVDGYAMDCFTDLLFEGLSFDVDNEDDMRWHVQSVSRFIGHRAHIELIDPGDGFIAVDEIRFADGNDIGPPSNDFTSIIFSHANVTSPQTLAEAYGELWEQSLVDWRKGRPTVGSEFIRWAITKGLVSEDERSRSTLDRIVKEVRACDAALPAPAEVVAIADGSGEDLHVHIGGTYKNLEELAPRQLLVAIVGPGRRASQGGSGRLELADQLLAADNPFPARVMANRIWAHLFGRGIVETVDNFGVLGARPTHPELLDYLASRFRDGGWSVKRLIREIMLSDVYQMSSAGDSRSNAKDPLNLLLHRANVRRLEGEAIRDAILKASGSLDDAQFGAPIPVYLTPFMDGRGRPEKSGPLDGNGRRSIYIEVRRNFLSPLMLAFDAPLPATCIGQRNSTNVPAQALSLLNDPFVIHVCERWAGRLSVTDARATEERITQAYLEAFSRSPSGDELTAAKEFLRKQAVLYGAEGDDERVWADFCHVLVNMKEFIFLN